MSIYHLHIPRTSGIYIKNNVLPHLISGGVEHFISNRTVIDPEKIKSSKFVGGHFGLMPLQYMDNPTVFCMLRDPVERYISYFKYTTTYIKDHEEAVDKKINDWLYGQQAEVQANMQSKFLTGSMNITKFNYGVTMYQNAVSNGWFIEDYSLDIDKIKENIDKFNCYTLDNNEAFKNDLNLELEKEFGFNTFKYDDKANESRDIGVVFTEDQIQRIKELNSIDMEIYNYVQETQKRL